MKLFSICLVYSVLFSHSLTSSLVFASPPTGPNSKLEKVPSDDLDSEDAGSQKRPQVNPSDASGSTSSGFNKKLKLLNDVLTLPRDLLFSVRRYLTQTDVGQLKHVASYEHDESQTPRKLKYNLPYLNIIQNQYNNISLQNKKGPESIKYLLSSLLPIRTRITEVSPDSVLPSETFGSSQELELHPDSSLRSLDLTGSTLTLADIQFIVKYFPKLEELNLTKTKIERNLILTLSHLENLRSLDLSGNILPNDILEILSDFPSLKHLTLSSGTHGKILLPSKNLSLLTSLNLANSFFNSQQFDGFVEALKFMPELTSLDLTCHRFNGSAGARVLADSLRSKSNPHLTSLNLGLNNVGPDGARALIESLQVMPFTNLTSLDLNNNNIGRDGARTLIEALNVNFAPDLSLLNLSNNGIGDLDVQALIGALKSRQGLTSLHLSANAIGPDGARILAEVLKLKSFPSLTSLDLSDNNIGPDGARALIEALKFVPELTSLNLRRIGITAEEASVLTGIAGPESISKLTSLDLSGNEFGDTSIQTLAEALKFMPELTSLRLSHSMRTTTHGLQSLAEAAKQGFISKLTSLDISGYEFGWELSERLGNMRSQALVELLRCLPDLTSLNLKYNRMSDAGVIALAGALNSIPKLNWLDLSYNKISNFGALALAEALKPHPKLKFLSIELNSIRAEGLAALAELQGEVIDDTTQFGNETTFGNGTPLSDANCVVQ